MNLKYTDPESMGRAATAGGDLLDDLLDDLLVDLLVGLLTPCAGTHRAIAFTMYKTGDKLSQLVILYFSGSW